MEYTLEQRKAIALAKARQRKSEAKSKAPEPEAQNNPDESLARDAYNTLAEFASSTNRSILGALDFLTVDNVNAGLNLAGSDARIPTLTETFGNEGGFMDEGLARDVVRGVGGALPAALGAGQVMRSAAGALPSLKAGESAGRGVARQLGQSTIKQDAAAGALAATGGEIGEEYYGETGRTIGSISAPMLGAAPSMIKEGVKTAFTGGKQGQQVIKRAVSDFAEVDSVPTLGQATGKPLWQALETRSGQVLGGAKIARQIDDTAEGIKKRLASIADDVSKVSGDVETGRVIQKGIIGDDGFVSRFQDKSSALWAKVSEKIPSNARSEVSNTIKTLDDLVRNDSFGKALNNPKLSQVKVIFDDVLGQTRINQVTQTRETVKDIPYKDLASLRSQIGEMLGSKDLVSDVPRAQLKRLYASLSEDIKQVASKNDALSLYNRANKFTSSGHKRLDDFVQRVVNKADLDKVFAAMARGGEGVQSLNAMKRSLKPDEWEAVAGNVIRQMGRSNSGRQDAVGEVFSAPKFLTDWDKLGSSKNVLFSGSKKLNDYRKNLDSIARASERLKETLKEGGNPSGTGQMVANTGMMATAASGAVTGNLWLTGAVLSTIAANKVNTSKVMANPTFVRWLASASKAKDIPAHIARLEIVGNANGLNEEVKEIVAGLKSQLPQFEENKGSESNNAQ